MKPLLLFAALMFSLAAAALPNDRVLKNFSASFPKADSVLWYEGENEYNVYFLNDGVKCRAWYDLDGNVKKSIRYYDADKLPPLVMGSVHKKYPDLKVFGVTEYSTPEEFVYQLALEDDKKWYMVNSDASGNLTLVKKLNKAD